MPGSLILQRGKLNSIIDSLQQGPVVLERGNGTAGGGPTGTIRSTTGGSAGHTSPTSSAGSTHLIFGHGHKQQQTVAAAGGNNQEAFYHHPEYYGWKQGMLAGGFSRDLNAIGGGQAAAPPAAPSQHEFFYWTQKHNQQGKKKRGGNAANPDSPSGSLHSRGATAASQQILFYPSYKKTTLKNHQQQQYPHYAEALEPAAFYQQQQQLQQQHRRHPSAASANPHHQYLHTQQQLQTQQLSSDEEQLESTTHPHLLHLMGGGSSGNAGGGTNRRGVGVPSMTAGAATGPPTHQYPQDFGAGQRFYRNKHSNCDLTNDYDGTGRGGNEQYYNQGSFTGDGPVYEEILSNRNSDVQHYDIGDDDDDVAHDLVNRHRNRNHRRLPEGDNESICDEDDDDEDDEDDDDEDDAISMPQSDERMRRLMAMQDEDFQRRFQ